MCSRTHRPPRTVTQVDNAQIAILEMSSSKGGGNLSVLYVGRLVTEFQVTDGVDSVAQNHGYDIPSAKAVRKKYGLEDDGSILSCLVLTHLVKLQKPQCKQVALRNGWGKCSVDMKFHDINKWVRKVPMDSMDSKQQEKNQPSTNADGTPEVQAKPFEEESEPLAAPLADADARTHFTYCSLL